ncbi:hypothetical protein Q7P37_004485 [Cladosporium fusiforme]
MPSSRSRSSRSAMYNTPAIRNGGFGALQVEAVTNRPLSIARRHLAASQLRMRDVEPDQLSSSEWVRFLVMPEAERERWISQFQRRRRNSAESSSSSSTPELDPETAALKSEEARLEAAEDQRRRGAAERPAASSSRSTARPTNAIPAACMFAYAWDDPDGDNAVGNGRTSPPVAAPVAPTPRRNMHQRRAVTAYTSPNSPPEYDAVVRPRARTPPPAYEPRSDDDDGGMSPRYTPFPEP